MAVTHERFRSALAGLLHDVGKLEQRAQAEPWKPPPGFGEEGVPVHAAWTMYFAQHHLPERYRSIALHAAYHHTPDKCPAADTALALRVAVADRLSAGERADAEESSKGSFPQQLASIFDRIALGRPVPKSPQHFLPLAALRLDRSAVFPGPALKESEVRKAYATLVELMRAAAASDPGDDESYLENLFGAMERSLWCVPSAYYHSVPDVSLHDHSRMTAALAASLAEWDAARLRELLEASQRAFQGRPKAEDGAILQTPCAVLIGGDLSGLQNFLYTLSSRGAARTLRGRSFYLQLLTEAILRFVLTDLEIPITSVVFSGGGHFYLLAPLAAEDRLPALHREITRKLLRHHSGDLYLALACVAIPPGGFQRGTFPSYWNLLQDALSQAKLRRFSELGADLHTMVFEPASTGGNPDATCSVCGRDDRAVAAWGPGGEQDVAICTLCRSFAEELGARLPQAHFVVLGLHPPADTPAGTALQALDDFGLRVAFAPSASDSVDLDGCSRALAWALDDPQSDAWPRAGTLPVARRVRYTVNVVPQMTFDRLQQEVRGGFERLGVLRMDVDDMGEVFSSGLGAPETADSRATLARMATLSFQVSLFFEGWVKRLAEAEAGLIYSVYAGGDDVFLIGPWDRMPGLATRIAADFAEYCCRNPDLHLSAGMAFIDGKYPVYQAAEDAGEALDRAKLVKGKSAFDFLHRPLSWRTFEDISARKTELANLVSDDGLSAPDAVLHTLQQLAASEAEALRRRPGAPVWGPWMWRGAYVLKRMSERLRRDPPVAERIDALRQRLADDDYQTIGLWGMAARWAQLELRRKRPAP